jgi:hypothetical protein
LLATKTASRRPRGSRIVQSSGVVSCPRSDGTVLVDVGAGRRITLDLFGSRVWMHIADQPTFPALVLRLRDDGSSAERLAEDVTRLLARWDATGVITWR